MQRRLSCPKNTSLEKQKLTFEFIVKGLTPSKNSVSPSPTIGHVIGLAMIATGFVQTNVGFLEGLGGHPPPSWELSPSGFATIIAPARELFYHDLPVDEGDYWVSKLTKQAQLPFTEDGTHAYSGWKEVPAWFLVTVDDKAFPVEAQRMMVEMAREAGGDVTVSDVQASHSPMLSRPEETAKFILEAANAFIK